MVSDTDTTLYLQNIHADSMKIYYTVYRLINNRDGIYNNNNRKPSSATNFPKAPLLPLFTIFYILPAIPILRS